jgi:hypothetical protein
MPSLFILIYSLTIMEIKTSTLFYWALIHPKLWGEALLAPCSFFLVCVHATLISASMFISPLSLPLISFI